MINLAYVPDRIKALELKNRDIILVDYFDTIAFRRVHSVQIFPQWAKVVHARFKGLHGVFSIEQLTALRRNVTGSLRRQYSEPPYRMVAERIYDMLTARVSIGVTEQEFADWCLKTDTAIENGCQYLNKPLADFLMEQKRKGKRIMLVSDFYLPYAAYESFFVNLGISNLFDKVYISETVNKTKADGSLYQYVLADNGLDPSAVAMIGDSRHSDVHKSREHGIRGCWYFPLAHKLWTNYSRLTDRDYGTRAVKEIMHERRHNTLCGEYAGVLYHFVGRLHAEASKDKSEELNFLARGGYFLKKIFDEYQYLTKTPQERLKATYFLISRRVVFAARDSRSGDPAREQLHRYIKEHSHGNRFALVDEGWYNHSQQTITSVYGLSTYGYYIGSCAKDSMPDEAACIRKGLVFDKRADGRVTSYYGIFCTNRSMYEQMLTAPHGSVSSYHFNGDGSIGTSGDWNDKERYVYDKYINHIQDELMLTFGGIAVWNLDNDVHPKALAKILLKSALFNNDRRCAYLRELEENMVDNCLQTAQVKKTMADAHINIMHMLACPEDYVGYFVKLQPRIYKNRWLNGAYKIVASMFWLYVRIVMEVRR